MVEIMLDKPKAEILKTIPLSDNTVKRRIDAIAEDIKVQQLEKIKESPWFALQLDEPTDTESIAQLVCLIRFISEDEFSA